MKVLKESFRCDLCGRFESLGVTETNAETGLETRVCVHCVDLAVGLIASSDESEDPPKGGRWHG